MKKYRNGIKNDLEEQQAIKVIKGSTKGKNRKLSVLHLYLSLKTQLDKHDSSY